MDSSDTGRKSRRAGRGLTALLLAPALAGALAAGCTSDPANVVGSDLHGAGFDSVLDTLRAEALTSFGNLAVSVRGAAHEDKQVLYLGRQGTESSSILAAYDIAAYADTFSQAAVDTGNIQSFRLFLYMLNFYSSLRVGDGTTVTKRYEVKELAGPLVPGQYPGPVPATLLERLNKPGTYVPIDAAGTLTIPLAKEKFVQWWADPAGHHGIMATEGPEPDSDPGLLGFAGTGFRYSGSLLDPELETTLIGPVLVVEFRDPPGTFLRLLPAHDLSTLEAVDPVPQDATAGIALRTHLRSYPFVAFSLAQLPPNVVVNRAVLRLFNDTGQSYGPLESIFVAEVDSAFAPAGARSATLDSLAARVRAVTARYNLDPTLEGAVEFNVTGTVQRYVNGAFQDDALRLLLAASEDFFSGGPPGPDPGFYLQRYRFFGTGADAARRPILRITYTRISELDHPDGKGVR